MENDEEDIVSHFLESLRSNEREGVPQGGIWRSLKTAKAAVGTGLSMVSGRFRGRGDGGLSNADLKAIERLVGNLGELKGLAMKMGQIMSYVDDSLPEEMRSLMALLQTQSQPTQFEQIRKVVEEDLGFAAGQLLEQMDPKPWSVASIGQVHRSVLPDGRPVAVKVLHPGMREALESDFKMAKLGPMFAKVMVPGGAASVSNMVAEARERMLEECDYAFERQRQREFGEFYRGHQTVLIPEVFEAWCGPRVLVTAWEPGLSMEEFLAGNPGPEQLDKAGEALFDFYFGNLYRHGLFHADPHPGNYAFRKDGKLVIYDFGCTRRFDADTVKTLSDLAHAVSEDREEPIRETFRQLGGEIPSDAKSFARVRELLRGFFSPMLTPGRQPVDAKVTVAMSQMAKDKILLMRLRMPGKLLFLFRIRFGLYAVLARLGSKCDWSSLERSYTAQL